MQLCLTFSFTHARTRVPSRARASTNEPKKRHAHAERNEPKTAATSTCRPKHARTREMLTAPPNEPKLIAVLVPRRKHGRTREWACIGAAERTQAAHPGAPRAPAGARPNPSEHDRTAAHETNPATEADSLPPRARANPSAEPGPNEPKCRYWEHAAGDRIAILPSLEQGRFQYLNQGLDGWPKPLKGCRRPACRDGGGRAGRAAGTGSCARRG